MAVSLSRSRHRSTSPTETGASPRSRAPGRRELAIAGAACAIAAAALYGAHVIRGGWYYDDWFFFSQLDLAAGNGVDDLVRAAWHTSYRPGYVLILLVEYLVGGTGQAPYLAFGVVFAALEGTLAFLVARMLGASRLAAGFAAALLIAMPTLDATRLWTAALPTGWAVCLYLLGLALALEGIRRPTAPRKAVAWHAGALVAYGTAILTSELVAPLVVLAAAPYAVVGGTRAALRRLPADATLTAAAVAYIARRASEARPADGSLDHIVSRIDETLAGAWDVFVDDLPASGSGWALAAIGLLALAGVAVAVRRGGEERRDALQWAAAAAAGAVFALAGLMMLLPAEPYYVPRLEGVGNRFSAASALGHVALLVALGALIGRGVATLLRRPALATWIATAVLGVTVFGMAREEIRHQDAWARSWTQSQAVVGAIRYALGPTLPHGSSVVTFRHAQMLPVDVPVFAAGWDLQGAVRLLYRDLSLDAVPFSPGFSCDAAGLSVRPPGVTAPPQKVLPYGKLYFVDATTYRGRRIADKGDCDSWRVAVGA